MSTISVYTPDLIHTYTNVYIYIHIIWNISIHNRLPARLSESSASCLGFASDCSTKKQKYHHVAFRHDEFINSNNCAGTDSSLQAFQPSQANPKALKTLPRAREKTNGWIIKIGEAAGQKITLGIPKEDSCSFNLFRPLKKDQGAGTLEEMFDDFRTKIKGRLYSCGSWMTHVDFQDVSILWQPF